MAKLERLGTKYGGWVLPKEMDLDENSIIYSVGVGEDISFDMLLSDKYKCNIVLVDPTKRAKIHYDEVVHFYEKIKWKMSGDIQEDYYGIMYPLKPDIKKIEFIEKGLWIEKKENVKFYKQDNEQYVSQSLKEGVFGEKYNEVSTNTLKNIKDERDHFDIDVLKLNTSGVEVKVLSDMLNENIFPRYICVQFSVKNQSDQDEVVAILTRLQHVRYQIIMNEGRKFTLKLVK
tara:strand:+ start:2996 stop:3688 length:693 start_codon:yes stop_codon:yes gene_type:complete